MPMIREEPLILQPRHLGNDVVDLADPRSRGKARDLRFLRRVFTDVEEEAIRTASDPDLALWLRWAGKESAFKSATKALGSPPVFHHSAFQVTAPVREEKEGPPSRAGSVLLGSACFRELAFSVAFFLSEDSVHAVSWAAGPKGPGHAETRFPFPPIQAGIAALEADEEHWRKELHNRLTPAEWGCVSHRASALTRLAAKEALAAALAAAPASLEIGCGPGPPGRRLPKVSQDGRERNLELTLSHHGRFQAWAFRIV